MSKLTPANLLSTAADLLDKYGVVSGHFLAHNSNAMCVHGALNQAQAILAGKADPDALPSSFYTVSWERPHGSAMLKAIQSLVDNGAGDDCHDDSTLGPWVSRWSNNLVDLGKGAEVIAKLRQTAEALNLADASVFVPKETVLEVGHA